MLTKRQKEVLSFIREYIKENDYSPSLEEIADHLGLSSVSTVHEHLQNLKEKGYLTKEDHQPRSLQPSEDKRFDTVTIPLRGLITAGEPIEAIDDPEPFKVSKNMLSKSGDHYALKVEGESMIDEGIYDGDIVIVREQSNVENGETAVAFLPEKEEATLKKMYKEKNKWKLQPANPSMKPFFEKNVEIQGKVVNVIRKF